MQQLCWVKSHPTGSTVGFVGRDSSRRGVLIKVKTVGLKPDPQGAWWVLWVGIHPDGVL